LRISKVKPNENIICKCGEHWFYFDVNPYYVDTLNPEVTAEFIKASYEPYYNRFGNRIEGFFTDEPQISRNGIPWSFVFENEYKKRYNEEIKDHLEELFCSVNEYKATRVKFWKMVTELFSENFMKPIFEWCTEHGYKLTGHLVLEDYMISQLTSNGACMPHYEYFHIPGMDWLGRETFDNLTARQLTSVTEQLNKDTVISETFALCGHNVSFAELKGIYEWQMVRGVNLLCQHLEGYSIRGIRKRDYPPAMHYQQPWWNEYHKFNDAMSREGMILRNSRNKADVLVIHPQTTAWTLYDDNQNQGIEELDAEFLGIINKLEKKHINFHLGDEIIIERHGKVENGKFIIGTQEYCTVIIDCCDFIFENTQHLLEKFKESGGSVLTAEEVEENNIIDNENITYTKRIVENRNLHYFVNTSDKEIKAKISVVGKFIDIYSGELIDFYGNHTFEPWGSLMLIEDNGSPVEKETAENELVNITNDFNVSTPINNCLTLDYCDYYFDGVLQEKNGYVLNICERANKLERKVKIHQDYHVMINYIPSELFLVCETPEIFDISVNGVKIEKNVCGEFLDISLKKIEISKYIKQGHNIISFECIFNQKNEFYENMKKAYQFESEKNKLSYDMEIEAIYLVGDFSINTDGEWEELENNAVRYIGDFVIDEPKKVVNVKEIEKQGFPFWCGEMILEQEIDIEDVNSVLKFALNGINIIKVEINGITKTYLNGDNVNLKEFNAKGRTLIKITLINNLRNLLGPHHMSEGEITRVTHSDFYKENCVWSQNSDGKWCQHYCFVNTGVEFITK